MEKFQVPKKFQSKVQEKLEFPKLSNVEFGKSSKFQRSSRARFDKVRVNVEFGKSSSSHRIPQEGLNKSLKSSKVELQSLSKVSVPNNFHRKVPLKFQLAQINSNVEFGNIKIPPTTRTTRQHYCRSGSTQWKLFGGVVRKSSGNLDSLYRNLQGCANLCTELGT